ncbi:MAG: glycosyltransferase family 1 protein, partial [Gammaproteobacteria bacterium]|nr:glycosyltransferase family 1 protein [Gammaproteobacteria bacterium]
MEITILATGSRGDVQPFVALGVGLQQAGYQVRFVSNAYFEAFVGRYGLGFRPLQGDIQAGLQSELGQQYLRSGNLLTGLKYMTREIPRWYAHIQAQAWQACRNSECLLYSLIDVYGYDIAQKLGVPAIQGHPQSLTPTRAFPVPSL